MKVSRLLLALVALASFCSAARAQSPAPRRDSDERAQAQLDKLHEELREAVARRDRAALERLYADEFVYIHSTGGADTKSEWIAKSLTVAASPTGDPEPARLPPPARERELHVYGDVAVDRGHNALVAANGQPNPRSLWLTFIYVRREGRWQIAQMQGTPSPAPRGAATVDPKILDAYAGEYEYANGDHVIIAREGGTLTSQRTGRPKVALQPAAEAQFFVAGPDSLMTFSRDERGRVTHFTIRRGQRAEETAKKIK